MGGRRAKLGIAFAATIVVFSVLTLIFWEFMRDTIVIPIYYLVWVGGLMLRSIDQGVYLILLVVIGIIIGGSALQSLQTPPATPVYQPPRTMDSARYVFWRRYGDYLTASELSRSNFAWEIRRLILSILAYQEGVDTAQAEAMVLDGTLNAPDAVRNLIQRRELLTSPPQHTTVIQNLVSRLRRRFVNEEIPTDPLIDQQVAEIVAFIEHRMEITHAGNQPES